MKAVFFIILFFFSFYGNAQIKNIQINNKNGKDGANLCLSSTLCWGSPSPVKSFELIMLNLMGVEVDDPNRAKKISDWLNENHENLICGDFSFQQMRPLEHIFKRMIAFQAYDYFNHVAESDDYSINFNIYEIVDGKKETLLDYVDKIFANPEILTLYNKDGLLNLIITLEELGVTRGDEID